MPLAEVERWLAPNLAYDPADPDGPVRPSDVPHRSGVGDSLPPLSRRRKVWLSVARATAVDPTGATFDCKTTYFPNIITVGAWRVVFGSFVESNRPWRTGFDGARL